jgi:TnpA family transposase
MPQWQARYGKPGGMIAWQVERHAAGIYAPLKTGSSSEVAAMSAGVFRHCTTLDVDRQDVESPGQSTVALALCHLLGFPRFPRLKAIHKQRLSRPEAGPPEAYAHLQRVLRRPIHRDLITPE